ncbi:MAG: zinc-dependent metalloprotease [Phaeodactylibacter sp.]|nr:zinc-dependent metalloprotease [Phaeodactylibacter sp.]MCB9051745.1 T9SS type A sorting domain-containing protein [Lewinellaceae bacterium]
MHRFLPFLSFLALSSGLFAQNAEPLWQDAGEPNRPGIERAISPKSYRVLQLHTAAMLALLDGAPDESVANASQSTYTLELPRPDGRMETFRLCESPVMAPGLAQKFPGIKTYLGKGVDNPTALARIDYTPHGFHGMVLAGEDTYFIDPFFHLHNEGVYQSYFKRDYETEEKFECLVENGSANGQSPESLHTLGGVGEELRTYRLAVSTTGEYAQFHGGTVEGAMAAIVSTMHRVNGVYERDMSVRMILIDSNHQVVFLNPSSDPFSGSETSKRNQNQTTLDQIIGSANYDVGHVFDRAGGGGIASLETVCRSGEKGLGYTGLASPTGDPFDIDFVAHELGHQYGGLHTFNYCDGSQGDQPYEPGSATTIMGYAGLCGSSNTANSSNDHFHVGNLDDMIPFTALSVGNSCAEKIPTDNTPPVVEAGPSGLFIPLSTPFELTASAVDMEGDSLTYSWEQFDLGPSTPVNQPQGNAPLFRSFALSTNPTRVFPRIQNIINNTSSFGERLPDYARNMNFRVTVRDNFGFGGGVTWDGRSLGVTNQAGPFRVLSQNQPTTWEAGTFQVVSWDVANTGQAPVNASMVNLYLSADGGFTYPLLLEDSLPNNGQALILVPDTLQGAQFRVKVKAVGNVFFDINNSNITIEPASAGITAGTVQTNQVACAGGVAEYELSLAPIAGFEGEASLSVEGLPGNAEASFESLLALPSQPVITISGLTGLSSGNYPFQAIFTSGAFSDTVALNIEFYAQAPQDIILQAPAEGEPGVPIRPELSWAPNPDAASYELEVSLDPDFSSIYYSQAGIAGTSLSLPATLPDSTLVYWRVRGANPGCGIGPYTAGFFETEIIRCQVYTTENLPASLDTPSPFVISRIAVEDDVLVRDVNIRNIRGNHFPLSGLNFRFGSPEGPVIDLVTEDCQGNAFNFNLDDQAPFSVPCPFNNGGTYRPEEKLDVYNGQNARGEWRLILFKSAQNGALDNWELEICFPAPLTGSKDNATGVKALKAFPNPANGQLTVELPQGLEPGATLYIRNLAGQLLVQREARPGDGPIDIHHLPDGMYFLQLLSREGQLAGSGKFVKTR